MIEINLAPADLHQVIEADGSVSRVTDAELCDLMGMTMAEIDQLVDELDREVSDD